MADFERLIALVRAVGADVKDANIGLNQEHIERFYKQAMELRHAALQLVEATPAYRWFDSQPMPID